MAYANIIGAGLAGLSAARLLAERGIASRLVSMQPSERAQSVLAEGGINAALNIMGENDTVEEHFADTMRGGVWLADPNAVWGLVNEAPEIVRDLVSIGVPFNSEDGHMVQRNFGGQKKKRTAYAKSSTGKALVSALIDAVRYFEAEGLVQRFNRHEFIRLRIENGRCTGVWIRDIRSSEGAFLEGPVILACGGMGGMFGSLTTGTTQNTGDVAAELFWQGVAMGNLEMLQYHPTTVPITGKRMLISEAARGEGGRLYTLKDGKPWYFMEELYPELGNLMPRDVVSREEYRVMLREDCCGQVWLDMRGLEPDIWKRRLSDLRDEIIHYQGIDPATDPVPVEPGIHYCMGGIHVDEHHRTNIEFLYAAGECCNQYHGANRLGGNSLLGAIRGGRVAARSLADAMSGEEWPVDESLSASLSDSQALAQEHGAADIVIGDNAVEAKMQRALLEALGIARTEEGLLAGLAALEALESASVTARQQRRLALAKAITSSALARKESRGAHFRDDFPNPSEEFRKVTVARFVDGRIEINLEDLPTLREEFGNVDDGRPVR